MKTYYATILIVEDDKNDQFMIETGLRKLGVTSPIHVVGDGAEAIGHCR
jgi:CheY-like chemotaxis protein